MRGPVRSRHSSTLGSELSEWRRNLVDVTSPDALLAALDPEQRAVATALDAPTVVIAGAGTGKTRAITHRIAYACAIGRYDPRAVLAVTFTTRAAGEMRGRLTQLGVPRVQTRTFHSAALRQAQYFWPRAYGSPLPPVSDARFGLVAAAASRLRLPTETAVLRDLAGEIGWAKVSNVGPDDYARIAAQEGREVNAADPHSVARVFAAYEELKRERGVIDFDDILLCTAALLTEHPDVADEVRRQYRHFVVDEYQDVSPLQEAVLRLWLGDGRDLCVVGDPAQTIHTFAGADREFLLHFGRRHPGSTLIQLVRDYRSTPQVVQLANAVMRRSGEAVTLEAQRESGPAVEFAAAANEADEAAAVAEWLARQQAEGIDPREMAVLFRINAQSPALEAALAQAGIPYLVRGAERFYERPEVRQAMIALRGATKGPQDDDVVAIVRAVLSGLGWSPEAPTSSGAQRERWESLAALLSVVEDMVAEAEEAGQEPPVLDNVVAELDLRAETQEAPVGQGVTLATLHSAKGLEWDAVALFGVHEGTIPFSLASSPAQLAEERRLLYVGITRARERLRVSWSRARTGTSGHRGPSRFLDGLVPDTADTRTTTRRSRRSSALSAQCRVCGEHLGTAAERKLGRHEDCPSSYDEDTLAALKAWRKERAAEAKVPAYCVFTDATLIAIAEAQPADETALLAIAGVGRGKLARYGDGVLEVLRAAG